MGGWCVCAQGDNFSNLGNSIQNSMGRLARTVGINPATSQGRTILYLVGGATLLFLVWRFVL